MLRNLLAPSQLSLAKEIQEIIANEGKSERAATRKAYKNAFYPEEFRKELQLPNGEKKIVPITFRGNGIEHLIDDLMGTRCPKVDIDELLYLEEHIQKATQIKRSGEIYKQRKDGISYFYYLETEIKGVSVEIHLAEQIDKSKRASIRYPYCIKAKKK